MQRRRLGLVLGATAAMAGALAAGCFAPGEEVDGAQGAQVSGGAQSAQQALASVVQLPGGCLGTKVGPKHVLVSARCLIGRDEIAAGKDLRLIKAAASNAQAVADDQEDDDGGTDASSAAKDAGAPKPTDAGTRADASTDAGAKKITPAGAVDITLAAVHIHPSFAAKCKTDVACAPGSVEASDAPDLAVLEADAEIAGLPIVPIDLDAVSDGSPVFVAAVGCDAQGKPAGAAKALLTSSVPAKSVNHTGSPYKAQPQFTTRLGASYVVTSGKGWKAADPTICAADFGGPLLRPAGAAVVGIHSGFTTFAGGKLPVTAHHTRLDGASRFKIGAWLQKLGAETIKTCSETEGGCTKTSYDGGAPGAPTTTPEAGTGTADSGTAPPRDGGSAGDGGVIIAPDAGSDAAAEEPVEPTVPPASGTQSSEGELPAGDDYTPSSGEDYDPSEVAPKTTKKKKAAEGGGCSTTPGQMESGAGTWLLAALGVTLARRRKSRAAR